MQYANSSFLIFNVYSNILRMSATCEECDIYATNRWSTTDFLVDKCKRVYNDIENNYYGYTEFIVSVYYDLLFSRTANWKGNVYEHIKSNMSLFTKKQMEIDKEFIVEFNKKNKHILRPDPMKQLFCIHETGFSIVYNLIKGHFISPIFFIKIMNNNLTKLKEDDILKHDDYKRFEFITNQISKYLNGGFYEQKKIFV